MRAAFSGSWLPPPSSLAHMPSATVRSLPASAVGGSLMPARTATVTVSGEEVLPPLVTVRENASVPSVGNCGAVNVGLAAVGELSVTVGPAVCVHA